MRLSVVIPIVEETDGFESLLTGIHRVLDGLQVDYEVLLAPGARRQVNLVGLGDGARIVPVSGCRYGEALLAGVAAAQGEYILTLQADFAREPDFIRDLWLRRDEGEILIASRYIVGSQVDMAPGFTRLSRWLNQFFSRGLSLKVKDMSSGYRLYRAGVLKSLPLAARDYDILQEILVRAYAEGWRVREVPFHYAARRQGRAHTRAFEFGLRYLDTFGALWRLRNSILTADYDDRAYDSAIPLQRYWQRERYRHIVELIAGQGRVLDVGCGSSRIIGALPPQSAALDILIRKLRYARKFGRPLVHGSGFTLPFPDASFPCVVCSQVIEHVPMDSPILDELCRTLQPGGRLVLGTPDYARWEWVWMEKAYALAAPGGYADEHISHYTRESLLDDFTRRGFTHEATRYILNGELILAFRKPE